MNRTKLLAICVLLALLGSSSLAALTDGLIAHYSFDEVDLGRDVSGQSHHGKNLGVTAAAGKVGMGGRFNGNARILVEAFRNYDWGSGLSVSVWLRRDGAWGRYVAVANCGYNTTGSWQMMIGREEGGSALGGGVKTYYSPLLWDVKDVSIPQEEWHHVAMTYDGNELRFYVDAVEKAVSASDQGKIIASAFPLTIGENIPGMREAWRAQFVGLMDEVMIHNRALSPEELAEICAKGGINRAVVVKPEPKVVETTPAPSISTVVSDVPSVVVEVLADEARPATNVSEEVVEEVVDVKESEEAPIVAEAGPEPVVEAEPQFREMPVAEVEKLAPPTVPAVAAPVDPCCERVDRWLELWGGGKKQKVINELNQLTR